jgi:hypothetical protein
MADPGFKSLKDAWGFQGWVCNPSRKRETLPMSEEALHGWYWAGVIVSALALWVAWYMLT